MLFPQPLFWLALSSPQRYLVDAATNAKWQPPHSTRTNNFDFSLKGHGVNGFVYNSSLAVAGYNYCNMPHVTPSNYETPDLKMYSLEHVEVIHRHHKRTPYASNTFPREDRDWGCRYVITGGMQEEHPN